VGHARKLDVARVNRFAGHFFDAVHPVRVRARDFENLLCLHGVVD
jgi:hypothetical protein